MISPKKETKQDIVNDNNKIESVDVRLYQQMSDAKQNQMGIVTEFVEHKKDVANSLGWGGWGDNSL